MAAYKIPRSVEEILKDYTTRRTSILSTLNYVVVPVIKALTEAAAAGNGTNRSDGLSLIAQKTDTYLMSIALAFSSPLDPQDKARLFSAINSQPSVLQTLTLTSQKPPLNNPVYLLQGNLNSNSKGADVSQSQRCEICDGNYNDGDKWYHDKCVYNKLGRAKSSLNKQNRLMVIAIIILTALVLFLSLCLMMNLFA